jgi:hypothetical protein
VAEIFEIRCPQTVVLVTGARLSMKLYHRTTATSAEAILRDGFKDGTGHYLTAQLHSGVWLSNEPLDCNEGATGDVLLEIEGLTESELTEYEWVEEDKPYREWLIPAATVNTRATVRIVEDEGEIPTRFRL